MTFKADSFLSSTGLELHMSYTEGVSGCMVGALDTALHTIQEFAPLATLAIYFHTFKTPLLLAKLLLERKSWSVYRSPFP